MKSGNLNFLEPSGPLQACNRLLYLYMIKDEKDAAYFYVGEKKDAFMILVGGEGRETSNVHL